MIALLANPPAPLALRVDLLAFRRPNRTPAFSELIWQLHQVIVNPASHAEDVKVAKRDMLRVIGKPKRLPKCRSRQSFPVLVQNQHRKLQRESFEKITRERRSFPTTGRSHEAN